MKFKFVALAIVSALVFASPSQAQFGLFKKPFVKGTEAYEKQDFEAALKHWTKAAENGEAEAQYRLGRLYDKGEGTPEDPATALIWYTKAAEQGVEEAQTNLGALYDSGRGTKENNRAAAQWFSKAAQQGNKVAQYNLALMLDQGDGIPVNKPQAAALYREAAAQGITQALLPQAVILSSLGQKEQAMEVLNQASAEGFAEADFLIGMMTATGDGVPADAALAATFLKKSADAGYAVAQHRLGLFTLRGELDLELDVEEGLRLLQLAADQSFMPSIVELAQIHEKGSFVDQDLSKAFIYYQAAAKLGNLSALNVTGERLLLGLGVEAAPEAAHEYFVAAAQQNHPLATYNLGQMNEVGIGIEQNIEQAANLYRRATTMGVEGASERLTIVCEGQTWKACFRR